jgi:hypothetical protein
MLYPLSYRGGAASHQRAADRTIPVGRYNDRGPPTDLGVLSELCTRSFPTHRTGTRASKGPRHRFPHEISTGGSR